MATQLTDSNFKTTVIDSGKVAVVDFWAEWCGPCKAIGPMIEEISKEYEGKVLIYKVNTDVEEELSAVFGIQSIPTLLFIDANGNPMMQAGAHPKHVLKKVIDEKLLTPVREEK